MGTSGVCQAAFSFDVPFSEYPFYDSTFAGGLTVYLIQPNDNGGNYSQPFYISSKTVSDDIINVKCYDRMTYTSCDFPCTEDDFVDANGNEIGMKINNVFSRIVNECGFMTIIFPDTNSLTAVGDIPRDMLQGKSCRDVLTALSEASCGYWCCQQNSVKPSLVFVPFGSTEWAKYVCSEEYSEIKKTAMVQIRSVHMKSVNIVFGGDTGGTDTITIDTPLASKELWSAVSDRTSRILCIYQGWQCENAVLDGLAELPLLVYFGDEEKPRYANYCNMEITASGIYASIGCNNVDEGEWTYKTRVKREFEHRYKEGESWKNVKITKNGGLKFVYINENE